MKKRTKLSDADLAVRIFRTTKTIAREFASAQSIVAPEDFRGPYNCSVCGMLACVCTIRTRHKENCKFRIAATGAVGIACEPHGRDVCPICDPCTCSSHNAK